MYFHRNYNRYRKHSSIIELSKFSATKHYFLHIVTTVDYDFF